MMLYTLGSGERAVGINPLPDEMQPNEIMPGQGKASRMSLLNSTWELLTCLRTVSCLSSMHILTNLENKVTWKTRKINKRGEASAENREANVVYFLLY